MKQIGREDDGLGLRFYPDYLLEILIVAVTALESVFALALFFPAVLGRRIDLVGQFSPRPEWYFLWLYELVKYFPGKSAVLGTVLIPAVVLLIMVLFPWIDPDGRRKWLVRGLWMSTVCGAAILTFLSLRESQW